MSDGGAEPSVFPRGFPRRGEIYMVDFGEPRGSAQAGMRPALVVSNNVNNQRAPVVMVAAITTTIPKKDYPMNVHLPAGVLPRPGTVYCHQILTLDKADLLRCRGELDAAKMSEVERALAKALGLRGVEPPPNRGIDDRL